MRILVAISHSLGGPAMSQCKAMSARQCVWMTKKSSKNQSRVMLEGYHNVLQNVQHASTKAVLCHHNNVTFDGKVLLGTSRAWDCR